MRLKQHYLVMALALAAMLSSCGKKERAGEKMDFNGDWLFQLADSASFSDPDYADAHWRVLDLPHDWSIEGDFSKEHPAGIGGGALPGGCAWYRKHFHIDRADTSKLHFLTFDGVYMNSEVYLNGRLLGKRPNGYLGFQYEISAYLNYGAEVNVVAVRVDNTAQPNSRWYSGSGIYRNVWLERKHSVHIAHWGIHAQSELREDGSAGIKVSTSLKNRSGEEGDYSIIQEVTDREGRLVCSDELTIRLEGGSGVEIAQQLEIPEAESWSPADPCLYTLHTKIRQGKILLDNRHTLLGIRSIAFEPENGFLLNGEKTKIRGVCMHHDLGALGAALNERALERQLEILADMGCNAIRTAHNPPAPELLELCDRMGFLVMNETFDMWKMKKSEFDYSLHWDDWHLRDLEDHLKRDRNHACIFSWSIGNEILEQWDSSGTAMAHELAAVVRHMAPGIPITSGCNDPSPGNYIIRSGELDLVGYNYKHELFESFPEDFPGKSFIATETTSALQSRGSYDMPSDSIRKWPVRWDIPFYEGNPDQSCSAYDNCHAPWGSTHEQSWALIKKHDYLSGLFIWTGFDYLGEPTPYQWPSRSSYFGIVDLAGFPKDVYYMYQSEWTDRDVLHIFPHWNWDMGQEIDVWAYSSFPEVELFINGISQGIRKKGADDLHLAWNCHFEPGTLKAVGRDSDGRTKELEIHTAGEPAKIRLSADRSELEAGARDLSFISMEILDAAGRRVPLAGKELNINVEGAGSLAAVDNGLQTSHHDFQGSSIRTYHGKALAIVRSGKSAGEIRVEVSSPGLEPATIALQTE